VEMVPAAHSARYLDVLEERVRSGRTGSRWLLDAFEKRDGAAPDVVWRRAVSSMLAQRSDGTPVSRWALPATDSAEVPRAPLSVGAIMTRDVFTVRPDDVVDLAASVMRWKHIRHVPVESETGELCGLLTTRELLALRTSEPARDPGSAASLMRRDFRIVAPELPVRDAMEELLTSACGCLLVVSGGKLLGIATERDLLRAAATLLDA